MHTTVYDFDANHLQEHLLEKVPDCFVFKGNGKVTWINIDGLKKRKLKMFANILAYIIL